MKEIPVLYHRKEECCGCGACSSVCPKGAIRMTADEEGFLYPEVDAAKCIRCFLCQKSCPFQAVP